MFRKSRVGIFILLALMFLAVAGAVGYVKRTYTVQTVYVEGNVHYTEEEIKAIVMSGPLGDNSLYLSLKYKNKGIEGIPFVDVVDVDILSPDTVKIIVYEKSLTGCVRYLDTYIYFDRDGYVVESSGIRTVGVPQIMGLQFDYIVTGEKLPVENEEIFNSILDITQLLQKGHYPLFRRREGLSGERPCQTGGQAHAAAGAFGQPGGKERHPADADLRCRQGEICVQAGHMTFPGHIFTEYLAYFF